jgi:hypothetical protein
VSPAPVETANHQEIMTLKIHNDNDLTLTVSQGADYKLSLLILIGIAIVCLLIKFEATVFIGIVCFAAVIFLLYTERELSCTLDQNSETILYKRGGILNTQFDFQEGQYSFSDIQALEIKRHASRGLDLFQIRLALCRKQYVNLSSANLDFEECQSFANEIHQFLGSQVPLRGVN